MFTTNIPNDLLILIGGYEVSHSLRRCELDQMELQVHNWLKEAGPDESR